MPRSGIHASKRCRLSRAEQELSRFLKVRLGRRKDHQELEVLDDVGETVLGKLGYEGDRPGLYRLSLPLDFELTSPAST